LTVLFSDIRGFTKFSENLSPEDVVSLLNPYLELMTEIIQKHGGTVDKYEGDAIIAFFGEPLPYNDHAERAALAALEMRIALDDFRKTIRFDGYRPDRFEIGIGINSGEVFVGLLGSGYRVNYTVIGDNVNLAARLQDMTKIYSWPIIISESTANAIKTKFETEFVESATIRGKHNRVNVYKLLGHKGTSESKSTKLEPQTEFMDFAFSPNKSDA
jgi:adenylate cyclase